MTRRTVPSRARPRRDGFTLLEVMLALALSGLIVIGVFGLMSMMQLSDAAQTIRFNTIFDRGEAQNVLRTSMRRLFAAEPLPEPAPGTQPPTGDQAAADQASEQEPTRDEARAERDEEKRGPGASERDDMADIVRKTLGDSELAKRLLGSLNENDPPHFQLYYPSSGSDLAPGFPRLELVLTESPVPITPLIGEGGAPAVFRTTDSLVRGAVEFATDDPAAQTAVMRWRPIDPPGMPVTLLTGIEHARFTVLPKKANGTEWTDLWAAYLQRDYPVAFRAELWVQGGDFIDWLFETTVLQPTSTNAPLTAPR